MPRRSAIRLTHSTITDLSCTGRDDLIVFDADLPGFGLRIRPNGSKTFILKYRDFRGRQRKYTIGRFGPLTAMEARKRALSLLGDIAKGIDPASEREAARRVQTVAELCDRYLEEAAAGKVSYRGRIKSFGTLYRDRSRIERHIKPLIGSRSIAQLTRADIQNMLYAIRDGATAQTIKTGPRGLGRVRGGQGTAVMAVKLLSAIFNYAIRQEWAKTNPVVGIDKPADGKRDRFLRAGEYQSLGAAIRDGAQAGINPMALAAITALALSGCRKGEMLNLKRAHIDREGRGLRFAETKTGRQFRPCGDAALRHLASVAASHASPWVFPRVDNDGPIVNLRKPLLRLCAMAGLEDVNLHTLRHAYATVAHELGYSELTIAGLLGHSAGSVTSRYAHHVDHALASAADRVAETIALRMGLGEAMAPGNEASLVVDR